MNVDQIWEKYRSVIYNPTIEVHEYVMQFHSFHSAIPDLLSSQWQTREPTKEDGDAQGQILVRIKYKDSGRCYYNIIKWSDFRLDNWDEWMSIPK